MKRTTLLVAVGVTFLLALAGCAAMGNSSSEEASASSSTPPAKVTATPIVGATLGEFKAMGDGINVESGPGSADIALVKVVLAPGGSTGWHHHPGVVLVSVKSGAATRYDMECHKTLYKAGKGWVESNGEVHVARNEGDVDAVLYATFLIPTETPPDELTITHPQPKNCDVK
jgi:quercetin dioxygenase-like cupin family protein